MILGMKNRSFIQIIIVHFIFLTLSLSASAQQGVELKNPDFQKVDQLIEEDKVAEALLETEKIYQKAKKQKNEQLFVESMLKVLQLKMRLDQVEQAIDFLNKHPKPKSKELQVFYHLVSAQAKYAYYNHYRWEIQRRENINSKTKSIKEWTAKDINQMILIHYVNAFKAEDVLRKTPAKFYYYYMTKNTYPKDVRPLLADVAVYEAVEYLSDSSLWTEAESNKVYKLKKENLLNNKVKVLIDSEKFHPLEKLASILHRHLNLHSHLKNTGAILEAQYQLYEKLSRHFSDQEDKVFWLSFLQRVQKSYSTHEWWNMGQYYLAALEQSRDTADNNILALTQARMGIKHHVKSYGAYECDQLIKRITDPAFTLKTMLADGTQKASVQLSYRNVKKLHFALIPYDLEKYIGQSQYGDVWFKEDKIVETTKPQVTWTVNLAETKDYKDHEQLIVLPKVSPGAYLIAASFNESFDEKRKGDQLAYSHIIISNFVLTRTVTSEGTIKLKALSGDLGKPVEGVEISFWKTNSKKDIQFKSQTTPANGTVEISSGKGHDSHYNNGYQFAKKGKNYALLGNFYRHFYNQTRVRSQALVFTDRNIFRPLQKVQWKIMSFAGDITTGQFAVTKNTVRLVSLIDANGQVVEEKKVTTNIYGTASGEFLIPEGRLLGMWSIRVVGQSSENLWGASSFRVEEYKRPTFEVSIADPKVALRLNKKAQISGVAKYYFGAPVSDGKLKWEVQRVPVWRHWWFQRSRSAATETIASGTANVKKDGEFSLEFLPEADEREAKDPNMYYRYTITTKVTDGGGETRQATKTINLGFVSLNASVSTEKGFYESLKDIHFDLSLTDLNGVPRSGKAEWQIFAVNVPSKTLMPSEMEKEIEKNKYSLPDDAKRARWETDFDAATIMRKWALGKKINSGSIEHDKKGQAKVVIKKLPTGVYRFVYQSKDEYGALLKVEESFIITGKDLNLPLPLYLLAEQSTWKVGDKARYYIGGGFSNQDYLVSVYNKKTLIKEKLISGRQILEIPVTEKERGGFSISVLAIRDYQELSKNTRAIVPWDNKNLNIELATFRDKVRPGSKETLTVKVKNHKGQTLKETGAEFLALMYDRSLDFFGVYNFPSPLSFYPTNPFMPSNQISISVNYSKLRLGAPRVATTPVPRPQKDNWSIGGRFGGGYQMYDMSFAEGASGGGMPRRRGAPMSESFILAAKSSSPRAESRVQMQEAEMAAATEEDSVATAPQQTDMATSSEVMVRSDFSETALWQPHLLIDKKGEAKFEFKMPEALTSWKLLINSITPDVSYGVLEKTLQTAKDIMVRPYIPRFLREGDKAHIKVMVNNSSDKLMSGDVEIRINDPRTGRSVLKDFNIIAASAKKPFKVKANESVTVDFEVTTPNKIGSYDFTVVAKSGLVSDGEKRVLPVLPSRLHLAQSRFVTLKDKDQKVMHFKDMESKDDKTLIHDRLVLTVDGQLFYGVLKSLPYLINYPYECSEQTLNRFLSTGIVESVFKKYPAVAQMAKVFSKRDVPLETFNQADANQRMTLEEAPWLRLAAGGKEQESDYIRMLNPRIVSKERKKALKRLEKMQLSDGGFPWFEGGRASDYMTLYILVGLSRALEFQVDVPKTMTLKALKYVKTWSQKELNECLNNSNHGCTDLAVLLSYVLSSFKDVKWASSLFTQDQQKRLLDYGFKNWKSLSPLLKGLLTLSLHRYGQTAQAKTVWASVMDRAKSNPELGTYWAPEDRAWLWYNDTIESHAFALRVQMELFPNDAKNEGLVQWLFMNKKLNHWKSTRATAESIYSLVHYLDKQKTLGVKEEVKAKIGGKEKVFVFEPQKYTGGKNQVVVAGSQIQTPRDATVLVSKTTPGFAFASTTWHFSTEQLPTQANGDLFSVSRKYFIREQTGATKTLKPLLEGAKIKVGDQVEVHLSLKVKQAAEYVHLRDPRGAGFEPEDVTSGYNYDLGLSYYREIRDSGANFFFNWLPKGQYTFKYRVKANMEGLFRVGPATLQSIYAPEFNAYSAGTKLEVFL